MISFREIFVLTLVISALFGVAPWGAAEGVDCYSCEYYLNSTGPQGSLACVGGDLSGFAQRGCSHCLTAKYDRAGEQLTHRQCLTGGLADFFLARWEATLGTRDIGALCAPSSGTLARVASSQDAYMQFLAAEQFTEYCFCAADLCNGLDSGAAGSAGAGAARLAVATLCAAAVAVLARTLVA